MLNCSAHRSVTYKVGRTQYASVSYMYLPYVCQVDASKMSSFAMRRVQSAQQIIVGVEINFTNKAWVLLTPCHQSDQR